MSMERVDYYSRLGMSLVNRWNIERYGLGSDLGTIEVMDMLSMSSSRPDLAGAEHWDKFYVRPGIVSMQTANILLNMACNARLGI